MEPKDLYVRIDERDQLGSNKLIVRLPNEDERRELRIALPRTDRTALSQIDGKAAEVVAQQVQEIASKAGRPLSAGGSAVSVLLDVRDAGYFAEDWESRFSPPWFPPSRVARFLERSEERLLLPFGVPMTLLAAMPTSSLLQPALKPETYLRYFKVHRASGLDNPELLGLLRSAEFSIVDLQVSGEWDPRGHGLLSAGESGDTSTRIGAKQLRAAMDACKGRLLLMQCRDEVSYCAALDVAHRMLIAGGPTVIVLEMGSMDPAGLRDALYMDVVHNRNLDDALEAAKPWYLRAALLIGIGGASVLQIAPVATGLALEATKIGLAASDALNLLNARPALTGRAPADETEALRSEAADAVRGSVEFAKEALNYARESGAWLPIGAEQERQRSVAKRLDRLRSATRRVVNVLLHDGTRQLRGNDCLTAGAPYSLSVQIGRPAERSIVSNASAFPDEALQRFFREEGVKLRVAVFGYGFKVADAERDLLLPSPPHESTEVRFSVRAPESPGRHRMRVCIYYQQNLLQSVLVRAWVQAGGARGARRRRALQAEVDYSLSGSLADVQRIPPRNINLLFNEGENGTHTIAVKGTSIREQFDFTEGEMTGAVETARGMLLEICADYSSKPPRYRFDADNRGSLAQLADDTRRLAEIGFMLFTNIVTAKSRSFQQELVAQLGASRANIQVSSVKAAQYAFPWALVYDHPVVSGGAKLCPDFEADLKQGGAPGYLSRQRCLVKGCAHKNDTAIVCPSGFWGFKHLIEQPMSVGDTGSVGRAAELVLEINVKRPDKRVPVLMAVSRDLQKVDAHRVSLEAHRDIDLSMKDTKVEIGLGLKNLDAALVYFYCHGGREKSLTWLGVGRKERMYASDLNAWQIDWSLLPPLVFINGCHTVDLSPDDLLNFCRVLGYIRAAGVIGTEISVTESLACHVAEGLLRRVAAGTLVGTAVLEERFALLERFNVLGLAYTPYCSSDLSIRVA